MKKLSILVLALMVCGTLLTGCRDRSDVNNTTTPTGMTTAPTTRATTPTTQATTPSTQATTSGTQATTDTTMPSGGIVPDNGMGDSMDGTDATNGMDGRSRRTMPGQR